MNEKCYYKAPLDTYTVFASVIGFIVIIISLFTIQFITPFVVIVLFWEALTVPIRYEIDDSKIIIKRIIWNIKIDYYSINTLDYDNWNKYSSVPFSCIGLRGWFGWKCLIYIKKVGWTRVYSRRISKFVLITTVDKNFIISPKKPWTFIEDVKLAMNNLGLVSGNNEYFEISSEDEEEFCQGEFAEVVEDNAYAEVIRTDVEDHGVNENG